MKLSLLLILPLLAISFASEDFDEDLSLSDDEGERELGGTPWYKQSFYLRKPPYTTSTGGSKCRKRTKRCCRCVDSCSSSSSDEEKKCVKKECKDKCRKAADKCYGSKKKWKVSDITIVIVCVIKYVVLLPPLGLLITLPYFIISTRIISSTSTFATGAKPFANRL